MKYIDRKTQEYLESALSLNSTGQEQDWAVELADPSRIEEFIHSYGQFRGDAKTRFALISLIAASLDEKVASRLNNYDEEYADIFKKNNYDASTIYSAGDLYLWSKMVEIIKDDMPASKQVIEYWAAKNEDDMPFASSLLYRTLS